MWIGYTAAWWGWQRIAGPVNLLDLISPGRAGQVDVTKRASAGPTATNQGGG